MLRGRKRNRVPVRIPLPPPVPAGFVLVLWDRVAKGTSEPKSLWGGFLLEQEGFYLVQQILPTLPVHSGEYLHPLPG